MNDWNNNSNNNDDIRKTDEEFNNASGPETNDSEPRYYEADFREATYHEAPWSRSYEKDFNSGIAQAKEPKYVTKKVLVITVILCMILTSAITAWMVVYMSDSGTSSTGKKVSATNYSLEKATGSEKTIQEIIAMNENAVVEIRTESISYDMWMRNYVTEGAGSGVIVDTKGYIITNNHVIDGSSKITVTLKNGKEYEATLVGTDASNDIAVLKIKAKGLTAATYGDSDEISVGDLSVAIGNPLGELGGTASQGIISATDRQITVDNKELTLLQTDASINPGNSGGGLFNQYGQLIGIVVAKSSGSDVEGLGFAIPINTAAKAAKEIIENGGSTSSSNPIIGVQVVDIQDAETAMQYNVRLTGVYIQNVTSDEAKKAGFKQGDLIYYVGDTKIENADGLSAALAKHKAGDKVKVTVIRDNQTVQLEVKLQESK